MKKGFTVLELLIVIGIMVILASLAAPIYGNFQSGANLNSVSSQITQDLRLAHERSYSGMNALAHGIKFSTSSYTVYHGPSYATRTATYDTVVNLVNSLTITTTLSDNEVNFFKGLGVPNSTGVVTITHSVNGARQITINSAGAITE